MMSSKVIDLTHDNSTPSSYPANENDSFPPNSKSANANMPSYQMTRLPPLSEILNYASPAIPNDTSNSQLLGDAIDAVEEKLFRIMIKEYCESIPELREVLESRLLVKGKDIVRYHDGEESEDEGDGASERDSDEEESQNDGDNQKESEEEVRNDAVKEIKPIAILDEQCVPRFASCLNCQEIFDLAANERGYCTWHTGEKEVNDDGDFWADHDEDCHGRVCDLVDEPGCSEGFLWSCCQHEGNHEGCKHTKHKAALNLIVKQPPQASVAHKRKAEEELPRPEGMRYGYRYM